MITAGTAIRESKDIIDAAGARPAGVIIALDRQERGKGELSAIQEVEQNFNVPVVSIIQLGNLIAYLENQSGKEAQLEAVRAYRNEYGI